MAEPAPTPRGPDAALRELHPASFALVMATGIVSVALHVLERPGPAYALFLLNIAFYAAVWALTLARVVRHRDRVRADLLNHGRTFGFFSAAAGTGVLGSQCLLIGHSFTAATALWGATVGLWGVLTYGVIGLATVKSVKPTLAEGINGGWLLAVVAAQSVSVLGAQLAPGFGARAPHALLFCLVTWLGAAMLYVMILALIFYRYAFFALEPSELAPPYWINMGAAAISALAGATLVTAAPHSPVIEQVLPFVRGVTLLWWATATWWIPMLLVLGAWRHVYRRFPLRYDPLYWGAVFPLGMYTVCTARLTDAVDAPFLLAIPRVFLFVALGAWLLTLGGMVHRLIAIARRQA